MGMWLQKRARELTNIPVCLSPIVQLPSLTSCYNEEESIIIMTANGKTLEPMRDLIRKECGVDVKHKRFHIVSCHDVPFFGEAVQKGEKVDYKKAEPGIIELAKKSILKFPQSRAILMECTELPPYANAVRYTTGFPVFTAITACNTLIDSYLVNKRFGRDGWQSSWDHAQEAYNFGDNLAQEDREKLVNDVPSYDREQRVTLDITKSQLASLQRIV